MESNDRMEQLLKQMYAEERDTSEIIDEEWKKFEARHFSPNRSWGWMQIAATIVGVLMLSGIAYAAIHIVSHGEEDQKSPAQETQVITQSQQAIDQPAESLDSIPQTRIFENVPLDEMVNELALYYNKVADVQNQQAHELRLYYKWEQKDELTSVVDDLNHFEHVSLVIEEDKLIVKP